MDTSAVYMENTVSIFRDDYKSHKEYLKRFQELCHLYDFKVQLIGGWMFFRYGTDYQTWLNQK